MYSQYKIPRVAKGSIPSIFPWTETIEAIEPAPKPQFMGDDEWCDEHVHLTAAVDVAKGQKLEDQCSKPKNEEISVLGTIFTNKMEHYVYIMRR